LEFGPVFDRFSGGEGVGIPANFPVETDLTRRPRARLTHGVRWLVRISVLVGSLTVSLGSAWAEEDDDYQALYRPPPAERRGDFAMGLLTSAGLLVASGFPNEADKIDQPAFEQRTGANFGSGGSLWLGGALRDWFVIGFGLSQASGHTGDKRVSTTSFISHVEVFPLFARGGAFRDLAVFADFGAGGGNIKRGEEHLANGGVISTLGGGLLFEPLRLGGFAGGPALSYLHQFSPSLSSHFVSLGFRIAFYASGT